MCLHTEHCKVLGLARSPAEARKHEAEIGILKAVNNTRGFPGYRHDGFLRSGERFVVYTSLPGLPLRAQTPTDNAGKAADYSGQLDWHYLLHQLLTRAHQLHDRPAPIFHGDISSSNVIVSAKGEVGLIDFGVSRSRCLALELRFSCRHCVAAPRYMSPEQAQGRFWGGASDIYQIGLVVLEYLRREPMGRGMAVPGLLARLRTNAGYAQKAAFKTGGLARVVLPPLLAPNPSDRPKALQALDLLVDAAKRLPKRYFCG